MAEQSSGGGRVAIGHSSRRRRARAFAMSRLGKSSWPGDARQHCAAGTRTLVTMDCVDGARSASWVGDGGWDNLLLSTGHGACPLCCTRGTENGWVGQNTGFTQSKRWQFIALRRWSIAGITCNNFLDRVG
ncbi:hypothetical protein F4775DRAFT_518877 [Biscogniauxia sp. FL1348]|nr:hypothetical protein F4775DRAFT_518877 [Biscogniauxia sp. FL1348]